MITPVTRPSPTPTHTPVDLAVPATCPACPHPLAAHDAIDLRFCRATTAGSRIRGCTCSTS